MRSLKFYLSFLFSISISLTVLAGPPMPPPMPTNQVMSQEGCVVLHPEKLPWKQPKEANWLGACVRGKAQGYGWYKFNLTEDGYPASKVDVFLEFQDGDLANDFYFAKMITGADVNYEGFAEAGAYQVNNENCLGLAECVRIMQALKEGGTAPRPPVPPQAPLEPEDIPPQTPLEEAEEKFQEIIYMRLRGALEKRFVDAPEKVEPVVQQFYEFERFFNSYAQYICQRNSRDLENCKTYQYQVANLALNYVIAGANDEAILFKLQGNYKPFEETVCGNSRSVQDSFACIGRAISQKEKNIASKHPRAMDRGSLAIAAYSKAVSLFEASGGSARNAAYLWSYEILLEFIYQQSITPWVD